MSPSARAIVAPSRIDNGQITTLFVNGMRAIHTSAEEIAVVDVEGIVRIVLALVDAARSA